MMTTKMMKRTAIAAIVGAMSYGAAGVAEVSAHALSVPAERTRVLTGAMMCSSSHGADGARAAASVTRRAA